MSNVLINGEAITTVSYQDRGLNYGDGLFETIEYSAAKLYFWQKHFQRLQHGCHVLNIDCPDESLLLDEIQQLNKQSQTVIKIILTRGISGRGYQYNQDATATRIVSTHPWPQDIHSHQQSGIQIRLCKQRLSVNATLAGIKHLNRLEQVIARNEWSDSAIHEGLMCDQFDNIIEGTTSNLFIVLNGQLVTSPANHCAVNGITRNVIIAVAEKLGIAVHEKLFTKEDLMLADEIFVCNSIWGIYPVNQFEDKQYSMWPTINEIQEQLAVMKEAEAYAL